MDHEQLLHRIRCEYLEMPGLALTLPQAQRLWSLEAVVCALLLEALVSAEFLARRTDGRFVRVNDGPHVEPRLDMAKAALSPLFPGKRSSDAA